MFPNVSLPASLKCILADNRSRVTPQWSLLTLVDELFINDASVREYRSNNSLVEDFRHLFWNEYARSQR